MSDGKYLSDEEIVEQWDAAKYKALALDSLAVKCRTDRATMRRKLLDLGVDESELPDKKPAPAHRLNGFQTYNQTPERHSKIDDEKARAMYETGAKDAEIAKAFGVSANTILLWRNQRGLPSKNSRRKKTEAVETKARSEEQTEKKFAEILESVDAGKRSGGATTAAEPVPDSGTGENAEQPLTLGGFRNALTAYLPAALNDAELYINGRPVLDLDAIEITRTDGVLRVNLTIRGAG